MAHASFEVQAVDRWNILLQGVNLRHLRNRRTLLASFDGFRRDVDTRGVAEGIDAFQRQAFELLTSSRLAQALDLSREEGRGRSRYGSGITDHWRS